MKKVIDADNMKLIETFDEKETAKILKKYEEDGRWLDVMVDRDGDIILWKVGAF